MGCLLAVLHFSWFSFLVSYFGENVKVDDCFCCIVFLNSRVVLMWPLLIIKCQVVQRDQSSLTPKKTPKFSRKAYDSHLLSVRPTNFFQVASLELTPDSLRKTHFPMDGVIIIIIVYCCYYTGNNFEYSVIVWCNLLSVDLYSEMQKNSLDMKDSRFS